jgi:TRAP-type transport system periplasmic protein
MKRAQKSLALVVVASALVLVPLLTGCGAEAPAGSTVVELRFSYHTPEKASLVGTYFQPWTAAIEQASGGTISITHYPAESRVKAVDQFDGVVNGLSDIGLVEVDATPGRFPKAEFYGLPGLFPNARVAAEVYYDIVREFCADDEFKDVQILGAVAIAPAEYIGNKPAQRPEDLKGQRVRSSGKIEQWVIEQLGGTALTSGVKEVTRYRTQCDLFYRCWLLVMNKDAWNALSPGQQQAIIQCSGAGNSGKYSAANEAEAAGAEQAIAVSDLEAGKPPIYELSEEERAQWKTAVMPVWQKWVDELEENRLPGQNILDKTQVLIAGYSTQ